MSDRESTGALRYLTAIEQPLLHRSSAYTYYLYSAVVEPSIAASCGARHGDYV